MTDDIALRFVQLSGEPVRNFGTEAGSGMKERKKFHDVRDGLRK